MNENSLPKVVLIGGMYGSGKSTLARSLAQKVGFDKAVYISFDSLQDEYGQCIYDTQERWNVFLPQILAGIDSGYKYIFAEASFYMRATRDEFFHTLSPHAQVYGLFFMVPMRMLVARLQKRVLHEGRITGDNYVSNLRRFNRGFTREDNTDLLLPIEGNELAPEYIAQMRKTQKKSEEHIDQGNYKWLVVNESFEEDVYLHYLQESSCSPIELQEAMLHARNYEK